MFSNLKELYLPRCSYSIFLEDKFSESLKILSKKKNFIEVDFYENELMEILKIKNKYKCVFKNGLNKKYLIKNKSFKKEKFKW